MNFLGIIPARFGSTRLEGKPLLDICGKPMIQRVYEQTKQALEHVVVATDDQRIYDTVKGFKGNVVMTSEEHNTGTNRCLEALQIFQKDNPINFDIVINIQGDEPLLAPEQIKSLTDCFNEPNTEFATLLIPASKENLVDGDGVYVIFDKNKSARYFSRSVIPHIIGVDKSLWSKKHDYYKHIGMYGYTTSALEEFANMPQTSLELAESLEQNRWLENGRIIKIEITNIETVPVDTIEDLEKVREIISNI